MKKPILTLVLASALVLNLAVAGMAEKQTAERDSKVIAPKKSAVPVKRDAAAPTQPTVKPVETPTTTQSTTPQTETTPTPVESNSIRTVTEMQATTAQPMAGEQIKWQVLSGGGVTSSSPGYILGATIGQTAVGVTTSTGYTMQNGYWQDWDSFVTSCCIGTTGNVNKSVSETPDLSDLSLLIAFLTVTPKPTLPCLPEANVNASVAATPDLSDLSLLIAFLTVTPKPTLPNCPS